MVADAWIRIYVVKLIVGKRLGRSHGIQSGHSYRPLFYIDKNKDKDKDKDKERATYI